MALTKRIIRIRMSSIVAPRIIKLNLPSGFLTRLAGSCLAALCLASFTTAKAVAASGFPALSSKVDALFEGSVGSDTPGAAVLTAREGKPLFEKGYGLPQLEPRA